MWTYDIAREQGPDIDTLRRFCDLTLASGYNALGLYLEHRFAYPSAPWAHGKGALTPEMAIWLQERYKDLQIIPFLNLLGHYEGFLYTEEGRRYAEERFRGMQACPSNPAFVEFARQILDDVLGIFTSEIVHIGGDETGQLGLCPSCRSREKGTEDGKGLVYGEHFGPLAQRVLDAGRRPAVWGDMFFEHPGALDSIPSQTLIFDWQYFRSPEFTSRMFFDRGFDVVLSPTLHTYNALWLHLPQSERNVREHVEVAQRNGAYGVCLTTWECGLMGNYETLMPAIKGAGKVLSQSSAKSAVSATTIDQDPESYKFRLFSNDQWTSRPIDGIPINSGITHSILMRFLDDESQVWMMRPEVEKESSLIYAIGPSGMTAVGQLPLEQASGCERFLGLVAGMDPLRRNQVRVGEIRGTFRGKTFTIYASSTPQDGYLSFRLFKHPIEHDPGFPLIGQGGEGAVAAYGAETDAPEFLRAYLAESEIHEEWARLMGVELQTIGGPFAFGGIRSGLKCRLLLYSNPFLCWLYHRELAGEIGDKALEIFDRAVAVAPDASYRGVADFGKMTVTFVQFAEKAHQAYANDAPGEATSHLAVCRQVFENLEKIARSNHLRIGGSLADIERCRVAREHVEKVIRRVKQYGDRSLGYLPSFETITHPKFVPHDQGNWWLINDWANE